MRFLVDECTGPGVAKWLRDQAHDVLSVYDEARGIDDDVVLQKARDEDRIIITNDKDFGEKVFRDRVAHKGIVLLRLDDERTANKIAVLQKVLAGYSEQLPNRFVAVTEKAVRIVGHS